MGQEASSLVSDDTRPDTLSDRSIAAVADLIKQGRAKRIVVMTGAGISTAAGIPDFRSPKTGLYHNLARLNLPHPEAVFEIDFFRNNPRPFYVLAKELYPGNFHPTISHAFVALLAQKNLLRMLFTQNIDCLERTAGVPSELIVEAHGSFATQRCIDCKRPFPDDEMRKAVQAASPARCAHNDCEGLVKPDIVFFGEQLPSTFFENAGVPEEADLVIVVGTSLLVHPFASLPRLARESVPRLLFNMERVGDFGTRADDVLCLGACDDGIRKLADELGWNDELEKKWVDLVGEKEAARQRSRERQEEVQDPKTTANAEPQEKKQNETSTTISGPLASQSADSLPLATTEALPTQKPQGEIEASQADENTANATPSASIAGSQAKEEVNSTPDITISSPIRNAGGEYRAESDNQPSKPES
ncbi:hypothetical protein NPX13_g4264 [Xylaria arbuscula]|uniref:Deacetylase sirtuin-type domain-containing protein n=1 Tax=Xylaria arbuscula TaxID=114810 RepID=A0A9W8NFT8_9PEZI|nr:hypothetical protein NPX13_g4264 [Xylaria arbuscula]